MGNVRARAHFWFKHQQKTLQDTKTKFDEIGLFSEINRNRRLILEKRKRPGRDLNPGRAGDSRLY